MDISLFNLKPLEEAFAANLVAFPNMEVSTREAHEVFFSPEFRALNSINLTKILMGVSEKHSELELTSLHGKLLMKVSKLKYQYSTVLTNFCKAQADSTLAALIVEACLCSGIWKYHVDKKLHSDGKFHVVTIVVLGGEEEESDLLHGYCDEPGQMVPTHVGHQRLSAEFKDYYRARGSMAFTVTDMWSEELLLEFMKRSVEYNSVSKNEKRAKKRYRMRNKGIPAAVKLAAKPFFYLPVRPDDRGREVYAAVRLFGMRPQGKLLETLCLDKAMGTLITDEGADHIKHIIYSVLKGKCSLEHALKHFSQKHFNAATEASPFDVPVPVGPVTDENRNEFRKAESDFGKAFLLNKCARALVLYAAGKPCRYIFGKDLTNCGLMVAGSCFGSGKMLTGANLMGHKRVNDSHAQFGKAHGLDALTRDQVKDIHTPLLHGSSSFTLVKELHKHVPNPDDYTEESVDLHNIEAYGDEVENIDMIASWGADVVSNHQNILKWTMPDGFPACHKAVMERTPYSVFAASTRVKGKDYKEYKVMGTMPIALDVKGRPTFGRDNVTLRSDKGVKVKNRGLFANATHAIDAMNLRGISVRLMNKGSVFLTKHDDFMVAPDDFNDVIEECQSFFSYLRSNNLYQDALDQISAKLVVPADAPILLVGNAPNKAAESVNFLMV